MKKTKLTAKLQRSVKYLTQLEAGKALRLTLKLIRGQFKIRPRLKLLVKLVPILFLAFVATSEAQARLKPHEAEIKINGKSILVAEEKTKPQDDSEYEISQAVSAKRSPFDLKKPVNGYISQGYSTYHRALDIAAGYDTPINSVGAGVVEFAGRVTDGKGTIVIVDHGDSLKSLYAHMNKINVGIGNTVSTETAIGTVGLTGHTTGPHVHLEIYDNGIQINPASVLPDSGGN